MSHAPRSRRRRGSSRRPTEETFRPLLSNRHYLWLTLALLVVVVYGSLIPLNWQPLPWADAVERFRRMHWVGTETLEYRGDWVVSILLYAALAFVLMGALCADCRRLLGLIAAPLVTVFCGVLAVAVEFTQVFFPPRTVSLNDIVFEAAGGGAGALTWLAVGPTVTTWCRKLWGITGVTGLATRLLPGYVVAVLVLQLMPFDLTLNLNELTVKYNEGKVWLVPFRFRPATDAQLVQKTLWTLGCFFPLGFFKGLERAKGSWSEWSWRDVFWVGAGVAALVEGLQLFMYSRTCDMTDALVGGAGVVLGWRLGRASSAALRQPWGTGARPSGPRPAAWRRDVAWAAAAVAWFAVVLAYNWQPFHFTTDPTRHLRDPDEAPAAAARVCLAPLADYYWNNKYQVFDTLVLKALSFAPLGLLAGLRLELFHKRAAWVVLGVAAATAVVVEAGQAFLPLKHASLTDVLIESFGAWAGFAVVQHVRAALWLETTLRGGLHEFTY